jgi:outer membrane receptor protein involved in Fe transport
MRLYSVCAICLFLTARLFSQNKPAVVSGQVNDRADKSPLPFVTASILLERDSTLVSVVLSDEEGVFVFDGIRSGRYILSLSYVGYVTFREPVLVGTLSDYLDLGKFGMEMNSRQLEEVVIEGKADEVSGRMDKKTFDLTANTSQSGGSVLQAIKNLPGVTTDQDGKVLLRGSDKVMVLIDGKQTALTGFNTQTGLDNIPASAVEKIEIINSSNAKYDASGSAGIINIVYKKATQSGFSGKAGMAAGAGALFIKRENLPGIDPQYQHTPKVNPSLSLNYRKEKVNLFFQGDYLYTQTLNKNEFVDRYYDDGSVVKQQTRRNRNTGMGTARGGIDWNRDENDQFTFSGLFGSEKIIDHGEEPFFNGSMEPLRLWQFLEDELKTTAMASAALRHRFKQPGRLLSAGLNYTFHRENEKYFFTNVLPVSTSDESYKLISDEHVADLNLDYQRPLKQGRFETGLKVRRRIIPTNMQFYPGPDSVMDVGAGGLAKYKEVIPALYCNYVYENNKIELEAGLRAEYVDVRYEVDPGHNTYKSDGYRYAQPFPNARFAFRINDQNKFSVFYNRRVDRPSEVDIRVFPKYDDAEIVKVGNPGVKPQFTNNFEAGYKNTRKKGYFYAAAYYRIVDGTITRIAVTAPGKNIIYNVMHNAGRSENSGLEAVFSVEAAKWLSFNLNGNWYINRIESFQVENKYPVPSLFSAPSQSVISGNLKITAGFHLPARTEIQMVAIYQAPDVVPQGRTDYRFSVDIGIKRMIQNNKGEVFINATDILSTLVIRRTVYGQGFHYVSADYYETQVIRVGYTRKF